MTPDDEAFLHSLTEEQVLEAINRAVADHDMQAVPGLLAVLAIKNPGKAAFLLDVFSRLTSSGALLAIREVNG